MLRKLKQEQKAFPERSIHFFTYLFAFVRNTRKVIIKNQGFETEHKHLAMKYQIQNARAQSSN